MRTCVVIQQTQRTLDKIKENTDLLYQDIYGVLFGDYTTLALDEQDDKIKQLITNALVWTANDVLEQTMRLPEQK